MSRFVNWVPSDLESSDDWTFRLGDLAVQEIVEQARKLAHLSEDLLAIDRTQFVLSAPVIECFDRAIDMSQQQFGLSLIKGFPTRDLSEAEFRVAAWGVGLYMGVARPQNLAGDIVTDVRDSGAQTYRVLNGRGYNTSSELDFHIDSGDVVLLFCRREAKSGGKSLVANPFSVAQFLIEKNPQYLAFLTYRYPFSLGGYKVDGKGFYLSPLLEDEGDASAFRINIKNIKNGAIEAGLELPSEHLDFLYEFQELAGSGQFCYSMYLEEGDIQILNNFHTIHSRTAFEDYDDPDRKRHLIRLWLCLRKSQPLPQSWLPSFGQIKPGSLRGGFRKVVMGTKYDSYVRSQCRDLGLSFMSDRYD